MSQLSLFDDAYLKHFEIVAGVDEAGRGPLAGPVFAAACVFTRPLIFEEVNDSKQLSLKKREALFELLESHPDVHYGLGSAEVEEIFDLNIYHASLLAMRRALDALIRSLDYPIDLILVDGVKLSYKSIPTATIVGGDGKSQRIAAASIIAKVRRDQRMRELALQYPGYGFDQHKGYATAFHLEALSRLGPSPIHRKDFAPVKESSRD